MTAEKHSESQRPARPAGAARLALSMSMDGLALMERTPVGWTERGRVSLNEEEFRPRMAVLRDEALALGAGRGVEIWLPAEQVLALRVAPELPGPDAFRRALAAATPHPLEELTWDVAPGGEGAVAVAATWRRTVREALAFAEEWGLEPLRVTTRAADADFPAGPTFAPTPAAPPGRRAGAPRARRRVWIAAAAAGLVAAVGLAAWLWPAGTPELPDPEAAFAPPGAPGAPEAADGGIETAASPSAPEGADAPAAPGLAAGRTPPPAGEAPAAGPPVIAATALLPPGPEAGAAPEAPRRPGAPARAAAPRAGAAPEADLRAVAPPPDAAAPPPAGEAPPRVALVVPPAPRAPPDAAGAAAPFPDAPPAALPRGPVLSETPDRPADAPPPPEVSGTEFNPPAPPPEPEALADAAEAVIAEGGAEIPEDFEDFLAGPEDPRPPAKPGADAEDEIAGALPPPRPGGPEKEEEATAEAAEAETGDDAPSAHALKAAPRPAPRPVSAKDLAEAEDLSATDLAALAAPLPGTKPRGLERRAAALAAARAEARKTAAAETEARRAQIPASASLATAATQRDAVRLGEAILIGVVGPTNGRRAIIRLADGEIVTVRRGESVGGWRVGSIGHSSIRLTHGGRTQTLNVPGE